LAPVLLRTLSRITGHTSGILDLNKMKTRSPAVAGSFYPLSKGAVEEQIGELFSRWGISVASLPKRKRIACHGVVVPHAGWDYSGYVAARVFADMPKADTIVIMGPNHYGMGADFSVSSDAVWKTPLGEIEVDRRFAGALVKGSFAKADEMAHLKEHSIEVQLPLLQTVMKGVNSGFRIVPISIKHYSPDKDFLKACTVFGKALAGVIREWEAEGKRVLIVASTDFTHYEPQDVAKEKDSIAMKEIQKMDAAGLFRVINENRISMCGYAGVATAIIAGNELGAKKAEMVAYMTSGDTTGDTNQVVGYGGLRIV